MRHSSRRGFTLIEVISAMTLVGFVLLGGLLLLDQIGDSSARIARESRRLSSEGNGSRLMHQLLLEASLGQDTAGVFWGDPTNIALRSMCRTQNGWSEVCRIRFSIDSRRDSSIVTAELPTGTTYSVRRDAGKVEFRYLGEPSAESSWFGIWSSNAVLPSAVGLVTEHDTIVFQVGVARD